MKILFFTFWILGIAMTAHADISCSGDGYSAYLYPGATSTGQRIPVAEVDGPNLSLLMNCNADYTHCSGGEYVFSRSPYRVILAQQGPQGYRTLAFMTCNK
jgi:hypothetical protein